MSLCSKTCFLLLDWQDLKSERNVLHIFFTDYKIGFILIQVELFVFQKDEKSLKLLILWIHPFYESIDLDWVEAGLLLLFRLEGRKKWGEHRVR